MLKLFYGNGDCIIEGSDDIRGIEIRGIVKASITKTCSDNFVLISKHNAIMIFPIGIGTLGCLFTYEGEIRIESVIVADSNAEQLPCIIKKVMNHPEIMESNAEDMTTNANDLIADYQYKRQVKKTTVNVNIIENQYSKKELYLSDGSLYSGAYHIHLEDGRCMTGSEHTKESQKLFIKQMVDGNIRDKLLPTKNPKNIPQALALGGNKRRIK